MEASQAAPAAGRDGEGAKDVKTAGAVDAMSKACLRAEKSPDNLDAPVGHEPGGETSTSGDAQGAQLDAGSGAEKRPRCCECGILGGADARDVVRVCAGCGLAVHMSCYGDSGITNAALESQQDEHKCSENGGNEEIAPPTTWTCDCCERGASRLAVACAYCAKVGLDRAMRVADVADAAASCSEHSALQEKAPAASTGHEAVQYGHVLCIKWDPRRLVPRDDTDEGLEAQAEDDTHKSTPPSDATKTASISLAQAIASETLPPGACCFCHASTGVRIQCRRVNCAQFFHAMCACQGDGLVEQRVFEAITQFHVYCGRHRECAEDMVDLLEKLLGRPSRQLLGRDDARRFTAVAKRLPTYRSVTTLLHDLTETLVVCCNNGLRASKREPPEYNVKQLQVLQHFLQQVPQLEKVYALRTVPVRDLVKDKKLLRRLEKTFDPPRYVARYPGPLSQQHVCAVCQGPFHERQHLFYCTGGDGVEDDAVALHMQHWRCTKRRSKAREREKLAGSSKKKRKGITVVQGGARQDVLLPKGLQSVTDDVICGVCRAPVDARGLVASRKEAKCVDFEKKASSFVKSGCYVNKVGGKAANGFALGPRLLPPAPVASTSLSTRKAARAAESRRARRSHSSSADRSRMNGTTAVGPQYAVASPALVPLKMERINVQRTTRWLACVGQIIRLAGACRPAPTDAPVPSTGPTSAASSTSTTVEPPANGLLSVAPSSAVAAGDTTATRADDADLQSSSGPDVTMTAVVAEESEKQPADGQASAVKPVGMDSTASETVIPRPPSEQNRRSLVSDAMQAYFEEAMRIVRPYDAYALDKMQTAREMLVQRSGPGVAVLRMLSQEYTRFIYIKHTRAADKARAEKRKREEHEAQIQRERERKRIDREAERALKTQMLAMRNKQRQHLKHTTS